MKTVKLISFHPDVKAHAANLRQPGIVPDFAPLVRSSSVVTEMATLNPAAVVLDLDKLPSRAREIALMLRASKSARHIPILLAGSNATEEAVPARLRSDLPDLPYAIWPQASAALKKLMDEPAAAPPVIPAQRIYTATLSQKLGIVSQASAPPKPKQIALLGAPGGFMELLGDLPATVAFTSKIASKTDLAICFIRTLEDLATTLEMLTVRLPLAASVWIAYPKRDARKHRDFNENDVRNLCLNANFVDYKICSIDASWSGMKFAHRKKS